MALELRDPQRSRMTRDLDMSIHEAAFEDTELRAQLANALMADTHRDHFQFSVKDPKPLGDGPDQQPTWRFIVSAALAGKPFETVILDVANRPQESVETELLDLPDTLRFADIPTIQVPTVNRARHFAEKLHALTTTYDDRVNTRVKDLPDLLLLIQDGLEPTAELRSTVEVVFAERATHQVPVTLDVPASWASAYHEMATELNLEQSSLDGAVDLLQQFWNRTLGSLGLGDRAPGADEVE
jgi:hypothetical protein